MFSKSIPLSAVLLLLAFPIEPHAAERLVRMQEKEAAYNTSGEIVYTAAHVLSDHFRFGDRAAVDAFLQRNTVLIYTADEVNGALADKDAKIAQAEAKIAQLTEMLRKLAGDHDALVKRFEEAQKE